MKRRIEELLNDTYRYQAPKLVLSEEHLELMEVLQAILRMG